ncbi:MAG: aminotransferase class IV [Deltaproteobacteria bacterium]|nr:aminotransferase class IV [Deltaproteobacteria bacterium]
MNAEPSHLWWDGRLVPWNEATTHVANIQWAALGSVFEGLRAYYNQEQKKTYLFGLDPHLERLRLSMRVMGMKGPPTDVVREAVTSTLRKVDLRADTYVRIFAWFDNGNVYTLEQPTHMFIIAAPMPSELDRPVEWSANVSTWHQLDERTMPPRVKAVANYHKSRLAGVEAERLGFDFPILLNLRGEVSEGPRESLFLVRGGMLITPELSSGILDSITRRTVLLLARELGVVCQERAVQRSELYEADEMFACGTKSEIVPVISADGLSVGQGGVGPVTRKLRQLYRQVVYGEVPLCNDLRTVI